MDYDLCIQKEFGSFKCHILDPPVAFIIKGQEEEVLGWLRNSVSFILWGI